MKEIKYIIKIINEISEIQDNYVEGKINSVEYENKIKNIFWKNHLLMFSCLRNSKRLIEVNAHFLERIKDIENEIK